MTRPSNRKPSSVGSSSSTTAPLDWLVFSLTSSDAVGDVLCSVACFGFGHLQFMLGPSDCPVKGKFMNKKSKLHLLRDDVPYIKFGILTPV
ncbi:hypothetical protein TNIN_223971 [Trichonephila inaurata madagascariensis]|uniref:Uncharacterized protein n=1 Tax=Trichonephila inaurata madagascariensis TaxID=2747483 RepID=A0A8X6MBC0_9ARAC|nr:hypothetical protein TNIN_223971 [Trichonephila inaurata madagascariensis]